MTLEQAFTCPRRLEKLRRKPLGVVVEGFCEWLRDRGFSRCTIRKHLRCVSHLNRYLGQLGIEEPKTVSPQHFEAFLKDYRGWCRARASKAEHLRRTSFSVHRFMEYLRVSDLLRCTEPSPVYESLLEGYLNWMKDYQHAAPGTLEVRRHSVLQFFRWLGLKATAEGICQLSAEQVETFSLIFAKTKGRSARRSMQSALRTFFRFCRYRGYIHSRLDRAVPTLRTYKLSTLPRGLTDQQAQQVLRQAKRPDDVARRDYAILQLLYTYGVRGAQVRRLCLQDIDWRENQILFRACKAGKESLLPLTEAVGESILEYLKNSRPPSSCSEVFLTTRAPYHSLCSSTTLSVIVAHYISAAGIEVSSRGAHAFRHCFATRMLSEGHSLKAIADVIGHRDLRTTFIYTKVDFKHLRQVGLEWPEEVER